MKVHYSFVSISLVVVLFCIGCANTQSKISFFEEKMESDNEAIVYVYRMKSIVGAAAWWNVYLDRRVVGVLTQGAYMPLHVSPGPHSITIGDPGSPMLSMAGRQMVGGIVEAAANNPSSFVAKRNEVYYVRSQGFKVEFVSRERAMTELPEMKYDTGK